MIKLTDILNEDYGGEGQMTFPPNHKAGMQITKGGSMCANCEYWVKKGNKCNSEYWLKWNDGNDQIPVAADEYCCNWWEAI